MFCLRICHEIGPRKREKIEIEGTHAVLVATKEVGLEVTSEETVCLYLVDIM